MITGEINIIFQPGQQLWPGLAWSQAEYISWADQARPNFQNSAWTGGLACQAPGQAGSSGVIKDRVYARKP
jgi:hypothetical protein